jgi:solute carrier family 50 protein (sugar transporter)
MVYAWLSDSIFPLLATFACGETFSIAYVVVYVMLTPNKRRATKILATSVSIVALVSIYIALARSGVTNQSRDSTATVVGVLSNIGSLVMYSSPFETIVRVVRTKNASSMPIHLCLVGAIGNSVWVLYASLTLDVIVLIPNVICSVVGWVQVIVYWIYRPGRSAVDSQKVVEAIASPIKSVGIVVETPESKGAYSETKSPSTAA